MRSTLCIAVVAGVTALTAVNDGSAQGQYPQYPQGQYAQAQVGQGQYLPGATVQGAYGQGSYGRGRWFPGRRIFQAFRGGVGYGGVASQVASDAVNVADQANPGIINNTLPGNAVAPNVTGNATINGVPQVNGTVNGTIVPGTSTLPGTIPGASTTTGNATINGVPQVNGKVNGTIAPGVQPGAVNQIPGSTTDPARPLDANEASSRKCVEMTVILPTADAELWFGKAATTQRGKERVFHSPDLEPGQAFVYKVKARWMNNGQPVEQERQLNVRAGQTITVTFRTAAPEIVEAPEKFEASNR